LVASYQKVVSLILLSRIKQLLQLAFVFFTLKCEKYYKGLRFQLC